MAVIARVQDDVGYSDTQTGNFTLGHAIAGGYTTETFRVGDSLE
jgi:hypothetical protein